MLVSSWKRCLEQRERWRERRKNSNKMLSCEQVVSGWSMEVTVFIQYYRNSVMSTASMVWHTCDAECHLTSDRPSCTWRWGRWIGEVISLVHWIWQSPVPLPIRKASSHEYRQYMSVEIGYVKRKYFKSPRWQADIASKSICAHQVGQRNVKKISNPLRILITISWRNDP